MATMNYNWETSAIYELIDMYKDRPVLWDMEREDYKDRSKKNAAWQEIAAAFGVDKLVVERKMKILVSQYRRELQRLQKGEASKWYAFNRLSYLKAAPSSANSLAQNQTESEEEKSEEDELYVSKSHLRPYKSYTSVSALSPQASGVRQSIDFVPPKVVRKRLPSSESEVIVRKKSRCSSYGTNKMVKLICQDIKSRDQFVVYGEHIANKLRNLGNSRVVNTVQFHINNIIYNAEMGKYGVVSQPVSADLEGPGGSQDHRLTVDDLSTESSDHTRSLEVQVKQEPAPPY